MLSLAGELARRHDVALLTGRNLGELVANIDPEIDVFRLAFASRGQEPSKLISRAVNSYNPYFVESATLFLSFRLSRPAQKLLSSADVISTHTKYDSLFFSRWASAHRIPSVFHIQGSRFGRLFRRFDRSTKYVGVSATSREQLMRQHMIKIDSVVAPGIPNWLISQPRTEEDIILVVARLQQSKGIVEAIRIFRALSDEFNSLRLVIIGEGPDRDAMEREVRSLSIAKRVDFLGALRHRDVCAHYARAKVLLFPSRAEVYPLVPLEALAAGCPVIATRLSGVIESCGDNAVLLPSESLADWIPATRRLLTDAGIRAKLSENGRVWARNHTWTQVGEAYERELLSTI